MNTLKEMTYSEIVDNAKYIRRQYNKCLTPFFNVEQVREYRRIIFDLDIEFYKKERLWEYLNNDFSLTELQVIAERGKRNERSHKANDKRF